MSRRGILFTVCLIGAALIAIFFLSSNKEGTDLSESKESSNARSSSSVNQENSAQAEPKKSPSSVSETTSASSDATGGMPGRGPRSNHPAGGKKSYDISHAQVHDDPVFAGTPWKVWSGVVAYPKNQGEPRGARLLGEVNGYFLVDEGNDSSSENFDPAKPLVVLRQDTGTAGVVSGSFAVILEDGASAVFLSQSPQLKLISSFPDIQT